MGLNLNSIIGFTSRVSSTAKAIFKGSANARQEMAALKTAEFFNSCEKDLFINGGVSKNQIEISLKKLCPGLNVNVKNNYSDLRNGAVSRIFSENTVIGYNLELPFSGSKPSDVLTKDNVSTLMHEVRHLMDFTYNPKYTGRVNTIPAFDKFKGYATRSANYSDFYENKIYASYLKHYKNVLGMSNETHTKNSQNFIIDGLFDFNQKLSQIEEMLGAEIKKERKRINTNLFLFGKP